MDLVATFAPQEEKPINYNVIVRVRNKPTPLQLNVKGEGYALSPSLLLELPDDSALELSSSGINTLDLGQVSRSRIEDNATALQCRIAVLVEQSGYLHKPRCGFGHICHCLHAMNWCLHATQTAAAGAAHHRPGALLLPFECTECTVQL